MRERVVFEREIKTLARPKPAAKPAAPLLPPKCAQPSPWPDADCARSQPSAERLRRRAVALANVIVESVQNTREHANSHKGPGLFQGSWDYHSAVHAHWALLSMARVHGFKELETWLSSRLSDGALAKELDFLRKATKASGFEMPYGWAWLLMVLLEIRRRGRKSTQLVNLTCNVENEVLGYLQRATLPERKNGAFIATHDSWLFAYLLVALSEPATDAARDLLRALRKNKLDPARGKINAFVPAKTDFMDLAAVLALIDRVDPIYAGSPTPLRLATAPALDDPPLTRANEHSAGTVLVQVWPHAVEARRGDKASCSRFHARMNEMFSRPDHWADSFRGVAHWVPQFMWMGMWLAAGRP
jgi:hypothetical protein